MTTSPPSSRVNTWKVLAPLVAILALVYAGLYFASQKFRTLPKQGEATEVRVGATVPDFSLKQLGNRTIQSKDIKGKVILLNFWASWCEACMIEMPSIIKLWNSLKERGFEVIAINVDENPESVVPPIVKRLGITFSVYTDQNGELASLFDVHAIPFTVILDKDRKVLAIDHGERDWNSAEIRTLMERWLSG